MQRGGDGGASERRASVRLGPISYPASPDLSVAAKSEGCGIEKNEGRAVERSEGVLVGLGVAEDVENDVAVGA
jgi:hypothetical protein